MWIQETAGEGVSVSLSLVVEDSWRANRRIHFVKCILMKEGYFCSQEKGKNLQKYFTSKKAKIRKSIFQEKRQRFAKVFLKKRQRFAKVFKYSSIQKKYSNCFGSFQGDKKDMQVQNISFYLKQNCNDINGDLNTCGLHCPSTTELRAREGEELRPANRDGSSVFQQHCAPAFAGA